MEARKLELEWTMRQAGSGRSPGTQEVFVHLASRRHTTKSLASALGVSVATAFRLVEALRKEGAPVVSMKDGEQWYYAVQDEEQRSAAWADDPLLGLVGRFHGTLRRAGESVDDALYGRR